MDAKFEVLGEMNGLQELMGNKKIASFDHDMNGFKYENGGDTSDCFIIDLENFSNGVDIEHSNIHSTTTTNSRITLQKSLSRKVPQRGAEKKITDRDALVIAPSSSPRAAQTLGSPENSPPIVPMASQDHTINNQQQLPQHQITIKTSSINTMTDGRWGRRSSFKRSSNTWFSDPKRILLFFATLSSMGTMLLIYFTLSVSKSSDRGGISDWQ